MISRGVLALAFASVAAAAGDVYNQSVTLVTPGDPSAGSLDGGYNGTVDGGVGYTEANSDITWHSGLVSGHVDVGNPSNPDNYYGFSTDLNFTGSALAGLIGGLIDPSHSNAATLDITANSNDFVSTPTQDQDFYERTSGYFGQTVNETGIQGFVSTVGNQFQNEDFVTAQMGGKYNWDAASGTYQANFGFSLDDLFATNWYLQASNAGELNISLDVYYGKLDCSNSTESTDDFGDLVTRYDCVYTSDHTSDPASWVTKKNGGVPPGSASRRSERRGLLDLQAFDLTSLIGGNKYGDNAKGALANVPKVASVQDLLALKRDLKKRQLDLKATLDTVEDQLTEITDAVPEALNTKKRSIEKRQDGGTALDSYLEMNGIWNELSGIAGDGSQPLPTYPALSEIFNELVYLSAQNPIGLDAAAAKSKRQDAPQSLLEQLPELLAFAGDLQAYDQNTGGSGQGSQKTLKRGLPEGSTSKSPVAKRHPGSKRRPLYRA